LQQCLLNLIFNAVEAMPEGGDLSVLSRLDPNQKRCVITVKDAGAEFPKRISTTSTILFSRPNPKERAPAWDCRSFTALSKITKAKLPSKAGWAKGRLLF
jgi:hypothetical protein